MICQNFIIFLSKSITNSVYLNETSSKEITNIISEFKNGKASDFPIVAIKHIKDVYQTYSAAFV